MSGTPADSALGPPPNRNLVTGDGRAEPSYQRWFNQLFQNVKSLVDAGGSGITQLTGDIDAGPGSGPQVATLPNVNANVGTFGDATHSSRVTVNAKGQVTAASSVLITGGGGSQTPWTSDIDGGGFKLYDAATVQLNPAAPAGNVAGRIGVTTANNLTLNDGTQERNVWIAVLGGVGFQNGWGNFGSGNIAAAYQLDPFGFVSVRGFISGGTATSGITVFTLPAGFRPAGDEYFSIAVFTSAGVVATVPGVLAVLTSGAVQLYGVAANFGVGITCRFAIF
jgi:hypothetical protein